jgi:thioredoxin 1
VSALQNSNPAYRRVKIIRVDWDRHSGDAIVRELNIPRRSTLVMFAKGKEVGRVVAQTSTSAIEALFRAAL